MEKKNFLLYETPEMEVLKMSMEGALLDSSILPEEETNAENVGAEEL